MPFNLPCDDIMELVGAHVETIRNIKHHKDMYNKCVEDLNALWKESEVQGYDFTKGKYWDGDNWLGSATTDFEPDNPISPVEVVEFLVMEGYVDIQLVPRLL